MGKGLYCVKCKKNVNPTKLTRVTFKNRRDAWKGKCPRCGTNVYRIIGKAK